MEEHNPRLKAVILQIVSNQLRMNDPPETRETLDRLGYSKQEAKEMIAAVVSGHIFDMLKYEEEYDNSKFVNGLKRLPKLPWEQQIIK